MKNLQVPLLAALLLTYAVSPAQKTKRTSGAKKVSEVVNVELNVISNHPDHLVVRAQGLTASGGWINGYLKPSFDVEKTNNGIYQFDFVATPPRSGETGTLTVFGEYLFESIPANLKSVVVFAENSSKEKKYLPRSVNATARYVSCDEEQGKAIVFNSPGDYKVVLQHLEMGKRTDANICIEGSDKCWEHVQNFDVGSAITFNNIRKGSQLSISSREKNAGSPSAMRISDNSCPPLEGYVYFEDANGFKMTLKVVPANNNITEVVD